MGARLTRPLGWIGLAVVLGCSSPAGWVAPEPIEIEGSPPPVAAPAPPAPAPRVEIRTGHPAPVERVMFAAGSAEIPEQARDLLAEVAAVMAANPQLRVVAIIGHADATEPAVDRERAENVRDALVKLGVPPERFVIEAMGASVPLGDNGTDEGRARNRRVDFEIRQSDPRSSGRAPDGVGGSAHAGADRRRRRFGGRSARSEGHSLAAGSGEIEGSQPPDTHRHRVGADVGEVRLGTHTHTAQLHP